MYDPTTIAAIINLASQLLEPIVKVAIDYLGKRMNKGTSKKTTPSAQRESTADRLSTGITVADIDFSLIDSVRAKMPISKHRKPAEFWKSSALC